MKVSDLTIEELKDLIGKIIEEKFKEFFVDPDYGLELKEDIEERLSNSLASKQKISLDEVKERLGL